MRRSVSGKVEWGLLLHTCLSVCLPACQVWNSFFSLTVLYINQPSLQLEALGPAKRKKVFDKYVNNGHRLRRGSSRVQPPALDYPLLSL